jgi:NAD(P)-dependent dehydrogenase (short-subunit alcohol dehydrogenase family)
MILNKFQLHGKTAMITGGSRGLGFAIASGFADAGANLVLIGRDDQQLKEAQKSLLKTSKNITIDTIVGDVSRTEEAKRVCDNVLSLGKPIDILVNNVGGRRLDVATESVAIEDWKKFFDLNLNSALICCQEIGKPMLQRGKGSIVNITSIAGPIAIKGIGGRHYETAKSALTSLTKSLAADWASRGVRVNAIAPGVFETEPNRIWFDKKPNYRHEFLSHIPMNRLGQPDEIAPAALFLASDASSYITGSVVVVDGGFTCW